MALKRKQPNKPTESSDQLQLFYYNPRYDTYTVRSFGRKTLEGVSPSESAGIGKSGEASGDALRGGGENQGRDGTNEEGTPEPGVQPAAGPRHGLGIGSVQLHPTTSGGGRGVAQNSRNYRIAASDEVGAGSLKQKFKQNVAAIRTVKVIEKEERSATEDEKRILVKYAGWGGIPHVFATPPPYEWKEEAKALSEVLTSEEWEAARSSTLNPHYTSPDIIRAIYTGIERMGFDGGRILEPACGAGHFIGLLPESLQSQSTVTATEIDSITARVSKLLYPDADIRHSSFEKALLPDNSFDLAISNVPFGDYVPYDRRFNAHKYPIHDYFFAATMERIRPGGLIVFITSKGTLDKQISLLRRHLSKQSDLVAAIRLPNTAFKGNAHTEVNTDIVILQKRSPGQSPSGPSWQESVPYRNSDGGEMSLNEYFVNHPRHLLGKITLEGRMYGRNEATLTSDGRDLETSSTGLSD